MGSTTVPDKEDLCKTFLGKVATTPSRLQRMQTIELRISRLGHVVPGVVPSDETG
ncbi:hypothetical protein Golob_002735 [Gossypium lobatum]|uniref:Uncharacterized protein n=1 Tax=Gossypium lobatum TaxID=34289 RepID=A0A7J8N5Z2_9ROSI|nr:hypothetical protein [Gossypium lobatum]